MERTRFRGSSVDIGVDGVIVETHSVRQVGNSDVCGGIINVDKSDGLAFAHRLGGVGGRKGDRWIHRHRRAGTDEAGSSHVTHAHRERVVTSNIRRECVVTENSRRWIGCPNGGLICASHIGS